MKNKIWKTGLLLAAMILIFGLFTACPNDSPEEDIVVPTVTGVTIEPEMVMVERANAVQLRATVEGTNNPSQSVTWSILNPGIHGSTMITPQGLLVINADEPLGRLDVRATSTVDENFYGTNMVLVFDHGQIPEITHITITGQNNVVQGQDISFTAQVHGDNNPPQYVTWSILETTRPSTVITTGGVLTVSPNETLEELTIQAASTLVPVINLTTTVTVAPNGEINLVETDWDYLLETGGFRVSINTANQFQEMLGFGASDAWSGNFLGQWGHPTPFHGIGVTVPLNHSPPAGWGAAEVEAIKQQMADWLFSQDFYEDGNPRGVGLSEWRVYLGAGSLDQRLRGRDSRIGNINLNNFANNIGEWERNAESFFRDIDNPWLGHTGWARPAENPTMDLCFDTKQIGTQFWMREARKRGVEMLVGFMKSAPVPFTINGFANNSLNGNLNFQTGRYPMLNNTGNIHENHFASFGEYMANVANHFAAITVPNTRYNDRFPDRAANARELTMRLNYLSPINEPQWEWNEDKQEGSRTSNANIARVVRALDTAIMDSSRPNIGNPRNPTGNQNHLDTQILITESAQWDFLSGGDPGNIRDQIQTFFNPADPQGNFVGDLPTMQPRKIAGHTYFTHPNDAVAVSIRAAVAARANQFPGPDGPIQVWSTEFCGLQGGSGLATPSEYFGMALFMNKLAHQDIVHANSRTFSFWTAFDMERGGQARYSLIAYAPGEAVFRHDANVDHPITRPGAARTQATLWALGHYSLFVRPGFTRVEVLAPGMPADRRLNHHPGSDYVTRPMATAYVSPPGFRDFVTGREVNRVVVVYTNMSTRSFNLAGEIDNGTKIPYNVRVFLTHAGNVNGGISTAPSNQTGLRGMELQPNDHGIFHIPARSMVTVVYDFPVD
ncbi:MAG: Ig-like domain-containing protein [Treponema sp.]|nr:Ig-like domain-containing protein [Treponema sp.]